MVPEVFLDFSPYERAARKPRSGVRRFAKRRKIKKNLWDQGSSDIFRIGTAIAANYGEKRHHLVTFVESQHYGLSDLLKSCVQVM